jgi:murein DD-endopeptidase MepM/ murein hydrolase activator NlpD
MRLFIILWGLISFSFALLVTPNVLTQGQVTCVRTTTPGAITFQNKQIPVYLVTANQYVTYLGTAYDTPTGTYTVSRGTEKVLLKILPGVFQIDTVHVPKTKEKEGATNFETLSNESIVLGTAFRTYTTHKYWQGQFVPPIKKYLRISSLYGAQRNYLDDAGQVISAWAHRGVDYATPTGNIVYAVNDGVVIVSEKFQVHGNTLLIDHGYGVISVYNHMDKRLVQKHERVVKGQWIGYSGNTGLTSGPHLHYGLSVNNVRVSPREWLKKVW